MALLVAIAESEDGATAKQLSQRFGLSLPTTYHLLTTLWADGMLAKDDGTVFRLGPQAGVIARAYDRAAAIPQSYRSALHEVANLTGETAYLSVWHGHAVRIVDTVEGSQSVRVAGLEAGYSDNLHARASGKMLLALATPEQRAAALAGRALVARTPNTITDPDELTAELTAIQKAGIAFDRQEFELGIDCIAMAFAQQNGPIACVTVSIPSQRFEARREEVIATLRKVLVPLDA